MSVRCFVVSDEFLRARGRTGTAGKTTNPTTQHRLQHRTRWARWNREGWRSQTHLSYAETPPGLQDGEHLSVAEAAIYLSGAKTNSARGKIQTHAFRGDGGAAKTHKCKYLKRSVPLHHCWLCLILWASTNNGKWDFFFFFVAAPQKRKMERKIDNPENTVVICVTATAHQNVLSVLWGRWMFDTSGSDSQSVFHPRGLNWNPFRSDFQFLTNGRYVAGRMK